MLKDIEDSHISEKHNLDSDTKAQNEGRSTPLKHPYWIYLTSSVFFRVQAGNLK